MKLQSDNDEEYRGISVKIPTVIMVASAAIFVVLAIVVAANGGGKKKHTYHPAPAIQEETAAVENEPDTLRADDLDFWDMYKDADEETILSQTLTNQTNRKDELEQREAEMYGNTDTESDSGEDASLDPATDGKHTLVKHMDGSTEWLPINSSLKLNNYEDTGFQSQNGIISYMSGSERTTKVGADISQYTTSVDWDRLATEVDYVMIRVGARGYDTGKIIADTKFTEYVKAAVAHGIPFGVYFSSQAISLDEAKEEAKYVTDQLQIIRDGIKAGVNNTGVNNTVQEPVKTFTPGTTVTTDGLGNVTTTTIDERGNSTIIVTDISNKVVSTTTINSDAYGNTSTVVKDGNGNLTSTKLEQKDLTTGVTTVTTSTYNSDGTVTTVTDTYQPTTPVTGNNGVNGTGVTGDGNVNVNNNASGTGTAGQSTAGQITAGQSTAGQNIAGQSNVQAPGEFALNYPVAVDMHFIVNDTSRIERISKTERTNILAAFCAEIEKSGYNSMVFANKEFLLSQVNLSGLSKTDIWVLNEGNLPDYPYMLSMWKYSKGRNELKSLSGEYGLDVGFIDYSLR